MTNQTHPSGSCVQEIAGWSQPFHCVHTTSSYPSTAFRRHDAKDVFFETFLETETQPETSRWNRLEPLEPPNQQGTSPKRSFLLQKVSQARGLSTTTTSSMKSLLSDLERPTRTHQDSPKHPPDVLLSPAVLRTHRSSALRECPSIPPRGARISSESMPGFGPSS